MADFAASVAPSELCLRWGILPGVAFAMRTYPRLLTAIAFAIESQPNSLRFDTPVRDNGNRVTALRDPSDTQRLMDVERREVLSTR